MQLRSHVISHFDRPETDFGANPRQIRATTVRFSRGLTARRLAAGGPGRRVAISPLFRPARMRRSRGAFVACGAVVAALRATRGGAVAAGAVAVRLVAAVAVRGFGRPSVAAPAVHGFGPAIRSAVAVRRSGDPSAAAQHDRGLGVTTRCAGTGDLRQARTAVAPSTHMHKAVSPTSRRSSGHKHAGDAYVPRTADGRDFGPVHGPRRCATRQSALVAARWRNKRRERLCASRASGAPGACTPPATTPTRGPPSAPRRRGPPPRATTPPTTTRRRPPPTRDPPQRPRPAHARPGEPRPPAIAPRAALGPAPPPDPDGATASAAPAPAARPAPPAPPPAARRGRRRSRTRSRGRDRAARLPRLRPTHELGDRRRQTRPGVGHLDPRASVVAASVNLDHSSSVLDRVRDQVPRDLREPQPIAPDGRRTSRPRSAQLDTARASRPAATPRPSRTRAARGRPAPVARDHARRVRTASRSSSTSAARPSSRSIARSRAGVSSPLPAP